MERELQLLRRVLGDPSFAAAVHQFDSDHFLVFNVDLPYPKYRGFPPRWSFAILREQNRMRDPTTVLADANRVIKRIFDNLSESALLMIISDSPGVHLEDNIYFAGRNVFCLDANDLPARQSSDSPYVEPLRKAVKRRLSKKQISTFFRLIPYQKDEPATGWRFYGRKRELEQLLDSSQSYVIVGGRRTGKTSLMMEANSRLQERGELTYYLSVEECSSGSAVVRKLLNSISARDSSAAIRRKGALEENLLTSVLKRLTSRRRVTLFLDEIGNVLLHMASPEDWSFFGILRQFSQQGRVRFVLSCFQESILRRQEEFSGPLVNFATTLRLGAFSRTEAEEFLLTPLEFWRPLGEERARVKDIVLSKVGRHPLFLQALCYDLFERVARDQRVLPSIQALLGKDLVECFRGTMDEVFWVRNSSTLNYLFLRRCVEFDKAGQKLTQIDISEEWLRIALRDIGFEAATIDRRNLLEGMELRGFTSRADGSNGDVQVVVAPIVFNFFKQTEHDLSRLLERLVEDMRNEASTWNLRPIGGGSALEK